MPTFGAEAERAARNAAHEQRARHEKERYERWMAKKVEKKARRAARTSAAVAAAADALVAEARAASPPPRLNELAPSHPSRPPAPSGCRAPGRAQIGRADRRFPSRLFYCIQFHTASSTYIPQTCSSTCAASTGARRQGRSLTHLVPW